MTSRGENAITLPYHRSMFTSVFDLPCVGRHGLYPTPQADRKGNHVKCWTKIGRRGGSRCRCDLVHTEILSGITVPAVGELLDFENLLPELIIALGLALLIGNGTAWWKHRQGQTPKGVAAALYRPGRVRFLVVVGLVLLVWGGVTLLN
jgi:hypothetical protein